MTETHHARAGSIARFFYEVREGARRQGNVIFALIFREIKNRSGQDSYGLLSLAGVILEPALGVLVLSIFWYLIRRQDIQGIHVVLFLTVGMTGFSIVRRALATIPKSVRSSRAFFSFPNVKPFDAIVARFIMELTLTVIGGVIMLILTWWFLDTSIRFDRFLEGMGVFALLILAALGLSLLLGVYGTRFPGIMTTIGVMSRGLLLLCAVIHPVNELPEEAVAYIAWNPVAHAIELMRWYFLAMRPFPGASLTYVTGFAMSMLFLGFLSYYVNRHKLIER